jgi:hypothetical protein
MAEAIGIAAGITSVLKAIGSAAALVNGVRNAPLEAREVARQLEAAGAILAALKASMNVVNRSQEFLSIWGTSSTIVLKNIEITVAQLNKRLGGGINRSSNVIRLGFWARVKWPFEREEGMILQQQLQGYLQMLSLVQNGLQQ